MYTLEYLTCTDYSRSLLLWNDLKLSGYASWRLKQGLECLEVCSQAHKLELGDKTSNLFGLLTTGDVRRRPAVEVSRSSCLVDQIS